MIQIVNALEDFGEHPTEPKMSKNTEETQDDLYELADYEAALNVIERKKQIRKISSQWTEVIKGSFLSSPETQSKLPAGVYKYVRFTSDRNAFVNMQVNTDELLMLPDSVNGRIVDEIETFLSSTDKYRHYNVLHRRGFMFYGPQGSGKSSLVQQILKYVIDRDGVVLVCEHPRMLEEGLIDLRKVEPNRFIVCMFEDIDALVERFGEKEILAVLDGEAQIDKVLNIATTNYPEKLDKRIVGRPRRFDMIVKIGWPSAAMREHYFKHKLKIDDVELKRWVDATADFSFAACAELMISVKCLGKDFDTSIATLKKIMYDNVSSKDFDGQRGFGFGAK